VKSQENSERIEVEVYGETVRTTLSMIIHKLVACSLLHPKLFILSPNVRVEKRERKSTGWHIYDALRGWANSLGRVVSHMREENWIDAKVEVDKAFSRL